MAVTSFASPLTSTGVRRSAVVPSPSWPKVLNPQHLTPPALVTAQVCADPDPPSTAATLLASPATNAGVPRLRVVPSPSCPLKLYPQHSTPPLPVSKQVCRHPVAIALALCIEIVPLGTDWTANGAVARTTAWVGLAAQPGKARASKVSPVKSLRSTLPFIVIPPFRMARIKNASLDRGARSNAAVRIPGPTGSAC